jgi:hypothetical protein
MVENISMVSDFKVKWDFPMFSKLGQHIAHYKDACKDPTTKPMPFYPLWYRTESGRILCPSNGYGIRNREDILAAIAWMEYYMPDYPNTDYDLTLPDSPLKTFFEIEDAWIWKVKEG